MLDRERYKDYLSDTQDLTLYETIFVVAIRILKDAVDYMEVADKMYEISGRRFTYKAVDNYAVRSKRDYRFPCYLGPGDCTGRDKRWNGAIKTFPCIERVAAIQEPERLLIGQMPNNKYLFSRVATTSRNCADAAKNCAYPSSVVRSLQRIAMLTESAAAEHQWVIEELRTHGLL